MHTYKEIPQFSYNQDALQTRIKLPMHNALLVWINNITILCERRVNNRRIISNQLSKSLINPIKPLKWNVMKTISGATQHNRWHGLFQMELRKCAKENKQHSLRSGWQGQLQACLLHWAFHLLKPSIPLEVLHNKCYM